VKTGAADYYSCAFEVHLVLYIILISH